MIIYLCITYESNTTTFTKDIEQKPFFVHMAGGTDVRMDSGDTICPTTENDIQWQKHKKNTTRKQVFNVCQAP